MVTYTISRAVTRCAGLWRVESGLPIKSPYLDPLSGALPSVRKILAIQKGSRRYLSTVAAFV